MFYPIQLDYKNITTDDVHLFEGYDISLSVLRLDKIHPVISGNKWFKLKHYLQDAKEQNKKKVVTFGGAYSNHIIATAAACQINGFASAGIIRGEKPADLSPTLHQAKEYGMQLYFISRKDYNEKKVPAELSGNDYYIINEGGYGEKGAEGAAEILDYTNVDPMAIGFTHCCCAVGTGTMMAGLIRSILPVQKVIGISVLKNNFEVEKNVHKLSSHEQKDWQIIHDYHFGGYAKYKPELIRFMNKFFRQTNIPADFVYTGKLFYGISDLIHHNYFAAGSRLLLIHSGGLQGNRSLEKGTLAY